MNQRIQDHHRLLTPSVARTLVAGFVRPFALAALILILPSIANGQESETEQTPVRGSVSMKDLLEGRSDGGNRLRLGGTDDDQPSAVDDKRLEAIKRRIDLLKSLVEEDQPNQSVATPPAATNKTSDSNDARWNLNGDEQPPQVEGGKPTVDPATADPENTDVINKMGVPVLTKPVNPLELANSLFMTQNYLPTIKSVRAYQKTSRDKDDLWPDFLIGCSYRQLNNFDDSEIQFRSIANLEDEQSYLHTAAVWNLQYLSKRKMATDDLNQIETVLNQVKSTMDGKR